MPRPKSLPTPIRRAAALLTMLRPAPAPALATLAALALLVACASTPPPPVQLYRLAAATPAAPVPASSASSAVWQLIPPVRLPEYLDRDAILVPTGASGLQALAGHRWAEPLRDSVPRLLRQDLATLLGEARVWGAPVPAGVAVTQQLRVELLVLEPLADRSAVTLQARWSVVDPSGRTPPRVDAALIVVPVVASVAGRAIDDLVAAHRLALWRLAERIVGVAPSR